MKHFILTSVLLFIAILIGQAQQTNGRTSPLNLDNPADNRLAFIKMRASLDTNEVTIYHWTGKIYAFIDGQRTEALFDIEAMNIAIIKQDGSDYHMLTRETGVYRDLTTGKILTRWFNPIIRDSVAVVPIWNDPVNQTYSLQGRGGTWGVPYARLGKGRISMFSDIWLMYPSPLPVKEFPENSRSDQYQAGELFQFFMDEKELIDPSTKNIYSEVGWTRISDFLPWMRMGSRQGYLVYQCRGNKTSGGLETIPADFREFILQNKPEYAAPPSTYERPNMTTWRYFRQQANPAARKD